MFRGLGVNINSVFIYALCEPDTGMLRYVGKTKNIDRRIASHITNAKRGKRNHRTCWIRGLLAKGCLPALEILDEVPESEWPMWEVAYIQFYKEAGFDLVNGTEGGEAGPIMLGSKNHNFGKKFTPEHCAKLSASHKVNPRKHWVGRKHTSEAIAKMRDIRKSWHANKKLHKGDI